MAAVTASVPFRMNHEVEGAIKVSNDIDCAIKSAARTITQTRLTDKIRSEILLQKRAIGV